MYLSSNNDIMNLFQSLLGNNFNEFTTKMPCYGFAPAGVHYCVLRSKG